MPAISRTTSLEQAALQPDASKPYEDAFVDEGSFWVTKQM